MTEEQATQIIALLENIDLNNAESFLMLQDFNSKVPVFMDSANILSSYGLIWFPLIMVTIMLWWVFKQFIYTY